MTTGTVKWFNNEKGYGFISPADGGSDVFVHISAVKNAGIDALVEGQKLGYTVETRRDGRQAATDLRQA